MSRLSNLLLSRKQQREKLSYYQAQASRIEAQRYLVDIYYNQAMNKESKQNNNNFREDASQKNTYLRSPIKLEYKYATKEQNYLKPDTLSISDKGSATLNYEDGESGNSHYDYGYSPEASSSSQCLNLFENERAYGIMMSKDSLFVAAGSVQQVKDLSELSNYSISNEINSSVSSEKQTNMARPPKYHLSRHCFEKDEDEVHLAGLDSQNEQTEESSQSNERETLSSYQEDEITEGAGRYSSDSPSELGNHESHLIKLSNEIASLLSSESYKDNSESADVDEYILHQIEAEFSRKSPSFSVSSDGN